MTAPECTAEFAAGYESALRDAAALSHDGKFVADRILALIPTSQPGEASALSAPAHIEGSV